MGRAGSDGKRALAPVALKRETLASQAAARIREMIVIQRFPPGMRLVETELAAMLGVSRMPVREALQALGREGLVALTVSKGAIVAERDPQELVDLFDARAPLEVRAVELAVERAAAACVEALDPILAAWRQAVERREHERIAEFDLSFHRAIWHHTQNRCLVQLLEQIIQPMQTIFYQGTSYRRGNNPVGYHQRIRDAIAARDAAQAMEAMRGHLDEARDSAILLVREIVQGKRELAG
jgi:DNA-binding GntR family transcriptional regulator